MSEGEDFRVDALWRDAEFVRGSRQVVSERRRTTDVDVTARDPWNQSTNRSRVHLDALTRADEFMEHAASLGHQRRDLLAVDEVRLGGASCYHRCVHIGGKVFEYRSQRGDPHSGPDEDHFVRRAFVMGEGP